ncbi:MAG: AAA family ATPase, partial [Prevotella sp.]|nr:AAA family ATPase [Prevotella sp.]
DQVDMRLLYSRDPARQGLMVVNYYQRLFREAIRLRNRIVALETGIARCGFATVMPMLSPTLLLENKMQSAFFDRYIRGEAETVMQPLRQLAGDERDYVERMLTFVYREQLAQKIGVGEERGGAVADLWNMSLAEKLEAGAIMLLVAGDHPQEGGDDTLLRLSWDDKPTDGRPAGNTVPNFRRGDMVYLYRYADTPDVRANILYKGVIEQLTGTAVLIRLSEPQHNRHAIARGRYAVEHASSDTGTTSALRSIHAFCTASADRRQLLLGTRQPRADMSQELSRSYSPCYDPLLLKAKQAADYFLLQGPPGTGKTSMALRFLVEEELASPQSPVTSHILLTAYTNRAVDEICGMLTDAGLNYLRIGNASSCDPRFADHLLEHAVGDSAKLGDIRRRIAEARIVVSTTSTLQSRLFVLQLKHFSLCIVDEASQILEPSIIGILASDSVDRFILIGDHKQLPAVVQQPDDEPRLHQCRLSLFERLLQQERAAGRSQFTGILRRQGRMHPDIARFPNEMFYANEQLECVPLPHQQEESLGYALPSEDRLDDMLKQHRVLFIPTAHEASSAERLGASDKVSEAEARMVADILRRIYRQTDANGFDADRTVGVIVPYRNQIAMIRQEIEQLGIAPLQHISIDTVERYQGSQRDVIIYSFTISKPYQLDFLTANCFEEADADQPSLVRTIDRKLNVAMTRARKQLIMIGDATVLRQNTLFAKLIDRYRISLP